jgi:putative PIN family toxin of toxin-antitoxin system
MLDTNVLLSAILFPGQTMNAMMSKATTEHQLVLSSYIVDELIETIKAKFPHRLSDIDKYLNQLSYELVYAPINPELGLFEIRDPSDYPVLYSAISADVDVFITGDKDFHEVEIEKPDIVTATGFLERY